MSDLGKTKKLCPNGHLMDPAWETCPYCPADEKQASELARTIKAEEDPPPQRSAEGRRTEILERPPTITGIGFLVGVEDGNRGEVHRIQAERIVVGADPGCEVVITDAHVSDRHASIRFREEDFHVTDLDSTNGTFLNDEAVQKEPLSDGDRVRFGDSEWVFKCVVFDTP